MIYSVLKWCARRALSWCYREVHADGVVPPSGPLLLAVNHPNELVDVCVVLATTPRRVYFVANVAAADSPLVSWVYAKMGVVPVHRVRDARRARARGVDSAAANALAFLRVRELLSRGECVCVFPEGGVVHGPHLGALRTGLARMALDARDAGAVPNVRIVPVGISYEAAAELRSRVQVEVGEPLDMDSWQAQANRPAETELTAQIARRMRRVTRNAPTEAAAAMLSAVADTTAAREMLREINATASAPMMAGTAAWQALASDIYGPGITVDAEHDVRAIPAVTLIERLSSLAHLGTPSRLLTGWTTVDHVQLEAFRAYKSAKTKAAPPLLRALGLLFHAPGWWLVQVIATRAAEGRAYHMPRRIMPGAYVMAAWYLLLSLLFGWVLVEPIGVLATLAAVLMLWLILPMLGDMAWRWHDQRLDRRIHTQLSMLIPELRRELMACELSVRTEAVVRPETR